jgi:UTP-glucose-1-phosphate uridylyltransferase
MLSVTLGASKELLMLGTRTVLSRIIDEAREAGLDGGVVVTSPTKLDIAASVDGWSQRQFADFPLRVAYQEDPKGLGHAVWAAGVEDDALVLAGDVVFTGGSPCERMANLIFRGIDGCVAVEPVEESQMHLYGIVELDDITGSIKRILEKPQPEGTESRWAVASRWAFSKVAMQLINDYSQNPVRLAMPREINLTEIINLAIEQGMEFKAVALQPGQDRVDCGSAEEYKAAMRLRWD